MKFELIRLLFDFGLLVLIWMVQLIIYPSFIFYEKTDLIKWHQVYVKRISYVVIPLLFGQLFVSLWQIYTFASIYTFGSFALIIFAWISTFTQFVPMHNKISSAKFDEKLLQRLKNWNWLRTALWSCVFFWTAIEVFIHA
ncbi:hypothetical protein LV716_17675 [Flagellimonas sp. HMM57]|uniref:hypothetical protein n=1 Tax=unclassified Flagellimonas TaxID=2644544 RepID=UPI0013D098DC|nr:MULTISPECIES: hypothetical protein [unclassified Flagellimonas]UII76073.1 hypothetical protein LV716_17675 [Flagellimonas sp. HMM57]